MKHSYARHFLALALLLGGCAPLSPAPRGEKIIANIPYKTASGRTLRVDLYLPKGPGPHPLVLWMHGGSWRFGDKGWMFYVRHLTRYGFAVASVEYRLSGRAIYPAQYEDCRDALDYLEQHNREYTLDPKNVFVAGASAGGHLAAQVGVKLGRSRINAVLALYPPADLTAFNNPGKPKGVLPDLLGGSVTSRLSLALEASPVTHVSASSPPFLLYHGDKDPLVPLAQSQELNDKLHAADVESTLVVIHGAGHNFSFTQQQLADVAAFFQHHLRK